MTKRKTTKTKPAAGQPCKCGCGETTSGPKRLFRMGHDARFHGRVAKLKDGRLSMSDLKADLGKRGAYALPFYRTKH